MLAALAEKCRLVPSTHIWQLTPPVTSVTWRSHTSSLQGHLCSREHTHTYLKIIIQSCTMNILSNTVMSLNKCDIDVFNKTLSYHV